MLDWIPFLREFGVPTVFLAAVAFGVWRVLVWLAPRVDRLFSRHIEFVDKVESVVAKADVTERTAAGVERLEGAIVTLTESHVKLADGQAALTESHTKLAEDVRIVLRQQAKGES